MTRLLALFAALITLNACEKHKAEDLPEEYRGEKKQGARPETGGSTLAAVAWPAPPQSGAR